MQFQVTCRKEFCDNIWLSFEEILIYGRLPPGVMFAQSALRRMRLSSLAFGVVCTKKSLTYITNDVLTSRHECKFDMFALYLDRLRRLANCKLYTRFCSRHPLIDIFPTGILFCSKRSHNLSWKNECQCKLC